MTGERLRSNTTGTIRIPTPDTDQQIAAILRDPAAYYADAHTTAYQAAITEVNAELESLAEQRNHPA